MQMNRVVIAGYVSKTGEVRRLPSGTPVANVRVGESVRYADGSGKTREHTNWHSISFHGALAEVAQALEKGNNVYVDGRIEQRRFIARDGRAGAGVEMPSRLRANWIRQIQSHSGWPISLLVLAFGGGTLGLALTAAWAGWRFNDSPSMPTGLYVRTSSESSASLVVFCPAEPFAQLSVERGYRSRGNCRDGAVPLAKPIAARPGDIVELSATGMAVNGRLLPNTAPLVTDAAGRPLPHWPFGRYVVAPSTVWVASSYSPRSFDSRYFGPVEASQVREHLRPLLTAR